MPISADLQFERADHRRLARAYHDDRELVSLVSIAREQARLFGQGDESEKLILQAQETRRQIEQHMQERGYVWPLHPFSPASAREVLGLPCAHYRIAGSSWIEDGKIRWRLRCKDCGAQR